ncbi:MAG TPA: TIGR03943 family protein [Ornithinibacter sp.]|nr:TIGR03943 family protein [Ornithinibacter sp.]
MKRFTQNGVILVVGVIAALAAVNGVYLNFVKPSLQVPLLVAAGMLLLLGGYGMWTDRRESAQDDEHLADSHEPGPDAGHGHDHERGPRVGWLLVVPFLLLGVVAPPPLGAFSAAEDSGLIGITTIEGLPPLADGDPLDLTLAEFQGRALADPAQSLTGRRVRLTGFASAGRIPGAWVLTRMSLNCCAADGFAVKVAVDGVPPLADDEWVQVVGTWRPAPLVSLEEQELPVLEVEELTRIEAPENSYE